MISFEAKDEIRLHVPDNSGNFITQFDTKTAQNGFIFTENDSTATISSSNWYHKVVKTLYFAPHDNKAIKFICDGQNSMFGICSASFNG